MLYLVYYIPVLNNTQKDPVFVYISDDLEKTKYLYKETCTNLSIYRKKLPENKQDSYYIVKLIEIPENYQLTKIFSNYIKESQHSNELEYQIINKTWNIDFL